MSWKIGSSSPSTKEDSSETFAELAERKVVIFGNNQDVAEYRKLKYGGNDSFKWIQQDILGDDEKG